MLFFFEKEKLKRKLPERENFFTKQWNYGSADVYCREAAASPSLVFASVMENIMDFNERSSTHTWFHTALHINDKPSVNRPIATVTLYALKQVNINNSATSN